MLVQKRASRIDSYHPSCHETRRTVLEMRIEDQAEVSLLRSCQIHKGQADYIVPVAACASDALRASEIDVASRHIVKHSTAVVALWPLPLDRATDLVPLHTVQAAACDT